MYADQLANKTVKDEEIAKILDEMFPVTEESSDREKRNAEKAWVEEVSADGYDFTVYKSEI